jgi:protein TonB
MRRHRAALLGAIAMVVMIAALTLPSCVKEPDAPPPPGQGDSLKPPTLIQDAMVLPEYPEAEREAGIEGAVILQARLLKDGSVGEITVIEGVEGHPALEESAKDALSKWRFTPATEDGKEVDMTIQIPLAFRLDNHKKAGSEAKAGETMPQLIPESIVTPAYPEDAREAGITGKVIIEAEVKPDGTPRKITVKEGIAGYPAFDQAAIEAVRQWRFTPGTRDGKPVSATVMIPLEFNLDDKK